MSLQLNMNNHLIIDGLPENVDPSKLGAFKRFLDKQIAKELGKDDPFALKMLFDDNGFVSGAFIDCRSVACADRAVAKLNRYRLTKTCEFRVYRWTDFDMVNALPDKYEPLETEDEAASDMTNPFMHDAFCKPQFVLKTGDGFQAQWQCVNPLTKKLQEMRPPAELRSWTELDQRAKKLQAACPQPMPMWSPRGTYMVTRHPDGVKLWAGKHLQPVTEFTIPELQYVTVSPCEKYLVTFTYEYTFWDIQSAKLIRTMAGTLNDNVSRPVYQYCCDDSLVSTYDTKHSVLKIYNAATMKLHAQEVGARHTIHIEGITGVVWSPVNPAVFGYSVRDTESKQGIRIQLGRVSKPDEDGCVDITTVVRRNFFKAVKVHLLWHPQGTHLAAKVVFASNSASYAIFRVGSSTASVDTLDVKGEPMRFAWQPNSARCSVITMGTKQSVQKIHFFDVLKVGYKEVGSFASMTTEMFWAPKGTRCLAVNCDKSRIEFYGVQGSGPFPSANPMVLIASAEHPLVTDATWDPTGRFLCTYTSSLNQQMDNSYYIWNVNAQKIFDTKTNRMSHVQWRPLMPTVLSEDDFGDIRKMLPKKSEKYTADAVAEQRRADGVIGKKRQDAAGKYIRLMDSIESTFATNEYAEMRAELMEMAPSHKRMLKALQNHGMVREEVADNSEGGPEPITATATAPTTAAAEDEADEPTGDE